MQTLNKIQKELKVSKDRVNKFGGYNYRNAEDILKAVKPMLGEATLVITDEIVHFVGGEREVKITAYNKDGSNVETSYPDSRYYVKATAIFTEPDGSQMSACGYAREQFNRKGMDAPQISGTASSYARKYALNGLFCIDDGVDADSLPPEQDNTQHPPTVNYPNQRPPSNYHRGQGDFYDNAPPQGQPPQQQPEPIPEQGNFKTPAITNPSTQEIFNALDDYFKGQETEGYQFNPDKLKWAVWQKYGRWPESEVGARRIKQEITIMDCCDLPDGT